MKNDNDPSKFGKYVKLFNSGAFSGIVELVDTEGTTVDIRTAKGEVLTVGRSDVAALTQEEESEFLRKQKAQPDQASPPTQTP